ncbi:hypothetical protein Zm00014a_036872, partial [Zea mays]
LHNHESHHIA